MSTNSMNGNLVDSCVEDGVENEKCVVAQYRTTTEQKTTFLSHLKSCQRNKIPIEWVIDIADESNGWFYGTAYDFDDTTQMLRVMVPDKLNPSFDGHVILDHRTVHLIECVDGVSDALFNKVIRDSIVKVKWDVEWFEETGDVDNGATKPNEDGVVGKWVASSARYYIRMANQLLVEDENFGTDSRGFVMLTADLNVKLILCHKGRGQDDFNRLVIENITQSSPEAMDAVRESVRAQEQFGGDKSSPMQRHPTNPDLHTGGSGSGNRGRGSDGRDSGRDRDSRDRDNRRSNGGADDVPPIRKLADLSGALRDAMTEVMDARAKTKKLQLRQANTFKAFALDGDLDAGLELLASMDSLLASNSSKNGEDNDDRDRDDELELYEDALLMSKKLEKGLGKVVKAGVGESNGGLSPEDIDSMRRQQKRLKEELRERDREIEALRAKLDKR